MPRRVERWATLIVALIALIVPQAASGLTVSVAEFRLVAGEAGDVAAQFSVRNDEPTPTSLSVSVTDWDDGPDGVTRMAPPGEMARSCSLWIAALPSVVTLEPHEERILSLAVRVPEGERGTYWSGLVLREGDAAGLVSREILVRVFVAVGHASPQAAVTELVVVQTSPLRVTVRAESLSDVRLCDVQGLLSVEGAAGGSATFQIAPFHVLPMHARRVDVDTTWFPPPGTYLVRAVLDYGAEALVAGQIVLTVP